MNIYHYIFLLSLESIAIQTGAGLPAIMGDIGGAVVRGASAVGLVHLVEIFQVLLDLLEVNQEMSLVV